MTEHAAAPKSLKEKALEELKRFWIISAYLIVFLGSFNLYRTLILAGAGVDYAVSYGFRLVEALVIAKVILIGEALGIGERQEHERLVVPVVRKSVLFGVFIILFSLLERVVEGLIHKETWEGIVHQVFANGIYEMLARTLVMMVALVPFFAFVEIGGVLGAGKLTRLFFGRGK